MKRPHATTIFAAVSILILVGTVAVVWSGGVKHIFGYKPMIVTTGSMQPEYQVNSLVIAKTVDYDEINKTDVIVFNSMGEKKIMHRVHDIDDNGLTTKGDNIDSPDPNKVTQDNLVGKIVWHTNFFADCVKKLKSPFGIVKYIVFPIVGMALLIVAIKLLLSGKLVLRKGESRKE